MSITVSHLRRVRSLTLRKRVWYKTLDKLERGIIDLTINLVESVRSPTLVDLVEKILAKLEKAVNSFTRQCETYGREKMRELVETAQRFGNRVCGEWYSDAFAKLLTLNEYHSRTLWRQAHS